MRKSKSAVTLIGVAAACALALGGGAVSAAPPAEAAAAALPAPVPDSLGHFLTQDFSPSGPVSTSQCFDGVTGYSAAPGYDLASGWGTIDAAKFVPALADQ